MKILAVSFILSVFSLCRSHDEQASITVQNEVRFYVDQTAGEAPYDAITFSLLIMNKTPKPIPDLRMENILRHAKFIVSGMETAPAFAGGLEELREKEMLSQDESDTFGWSTSLESVQKQYGDNFTIQWQYMGVRSEILRVDLKRRTVENDNPVVNYLENADFQCENEGQEENVITALKDILNLSEKELQTKRYRDYTGKPDQWDLPTLIYRHFVPDKEGRTLGKSFYHDVKTSEGQEIVKEILERIKLSEVAKNVAIIKELTSKEPPSVIPSINQEIPAKTLEVAVDILKKTDLVYSTHVGRGGVIPKENWAFNIVLRSRNRVEIFKELLEIENKATRSYAICGLFMVSRENFDYGKAKYLQNEFEVTIYIGCVGYRLSNKEFLSLVETGNLSKIMILRKVSLRYRKYEL